LKLKEVKTGIVTLIKSKFPSIKIYSMSVVENMKRPAFCMQLKPTQTEPSNFNTRRNQMTLYIDYFQKVVDEGDILDVIDDLRDLFGLSIQIGDRAIDVTAFDWDYIGTDRNVPEISIDLEWSDRIVHEVTEPLMESMALNENLEEE
jgi:hypothetical protein